MAVAVASSTITAGTLLGGSLSYTSNKPTGTAINELLLGFYFGISTGTPTALGNQAGFTKIRSRIDSASGFVYQIGAYYRLVDGTEGASFTFTETATGPTGGSLSILRVTGAALSSFINDSADSFTGSGTSPTAASVSPNVTGALQVIYAQGASNTANTGTDWAAAASSGFALATGSTLNDTGNQWYMGAESKLLSGTGATGTTAIPFSGGINTIFQAITLAIAPPAAATYPFRRDYSYLLEQ